MGLTSEQKIVEKKKEEVKSEWTFRRLFPFKATVSHLTKSFANPFDVLLSYLILIMTVSILIGLEISWMFYFLVFSVLVADVVERQKAPIIKEEKKK